MKLDLTSLYFNGDTKTRGNTASWGTSLGQKEGNEISTKGAQEIILLMERLENKVVFDPKNNIYQNADFKQIDKKYFPYAASFMQVIVNGNLIEGPFHLVVVEDTPEAVKTEKHWGRKNLKYNPEIIINGSSNREFYSKIQSVLGANACWFASEIFSKDNRLNLTIIKVSDNVKEYQDNNERKKHWEYLMSDFSNIIEIFKNYCLFVRKIKHESSVKEYIRAMSNVKEWFVKNGVCDEYFQIWDVTNNIEFINLKLSGSHSVAWKKAAEKSELGDYGFMMASWNRWNEFLKWYHQQKIKTDSFFEIFNSDTKIAGLLIEKFFSSRFFSSLLTKPFVILTGLSGSGKTKLAQAFAMWLSCSKEQYAIIPVGADWTNKEPLLGYPNSLNKNHYVKPDSGVLDIVLAAYNDYSSNNQELAKCKPYFLILDEMNLSHVERYFADFLSTMESGDVIKLYSGGIRSSSLSATGKYLTASHVPDKIKLPKNLFIIGTVNIDETTYMFSPKVLDRANTIEFRISESEMISFFETNGTLNMNLLLDDSQTNKGKGAQFTAEFMRLAAGEKIGTNKSLHQVTFLSFFDQLQEAGAEFGYRTANEMTQLMAYLDFFGVHGNEAYDIAIMQKLLPKLHGSRSKLSKVLPALLNLCMDSSQEIIFPLSFEKLSRMQKNAQENGFASYAEA